MKIFKDTTHWTNEQLLKSVQKLYPVIFGLGFIIGIAILMAGDASKHNDFENTLLLIGIGTFLLFISVLLYTFVHNKVIPELKKRLRNE